MQTKLQKQQKALAYWKKELESRLANSCRFSQYQIAYVKSQIHILESKGVYVCNDESV